MNKWIYGALVMGSFAVGLILKPNEAFAGLASRARATSSGGSSVTSPATGAGTDTCTGAGCLIGPAGVVSGGGMRVTQTSPGVCWENTSGTWCFVQSGADLLMKNGSTTYATWSSSTGTLTASYGFNAGGGNGFDTGPAVGYKTNGRFLFAPAAASIASGFGTNPSISSANSSAFRVTIGTGGTASTGVVTMPTSNGLSTTWNCICEDETVGVGHTKQSASTSTSVTITNYTPATGVALAWGAGEVVFCNCMPN